MGRMKKKFGMIISIIMKTCAIPFLCYMCLQFILVTLPIVNTVLVKKIIDAIGVKREYPFLLELSILFVFIIILQKLGISFLEITRKIITERIIKWFNEDIMRNMSEMDIEVLDTGEGRKLIDNVKDAPAIILDFIFRFVIFMSGIYSLVITMYTIISFDALVSTIYLVLTIPGIIMETIAKRKIDVWNMDSAPDIRRFSYYRWMLTDRWPAKDIRMYNLTDHIKTRYVQEKSEYINIKKKINFKGLLWSVLSIFIYEIGYVFFCCCVINRVMNGNITIGDTTMLISYSLLATQSFRECGLIIMNYKSIISKHIERYCWFQNTNRINNMGKRICKKFECLEFIDVHFKYPNSNEEILKGVSFEIRKGDKVSIVGINGAGKTTIIKLIIGLYHVDKGEILLNHIPLYEYDLNSVRRLFSIVFQDYPIYSLTLRENIGLSNPANMYDDDKILSALHECDVEMEDLNLDTNLTKTFDDNGVVMSKGQFQRVVLARAMFKDADFIIFDEPSSSLDSEAEEHVFTNYIKQTKNKTGLMISHRISSGKLSNKIIVLSDGVVECIGNHSELIKRKGTYAKLFLLQAKQYEQGGDNSNAK